MAISRWARAHEIIFIVRVCECECLCVSYSVYFSDFSRCARARQEFAEDYLKKHPSSGKVVVFSSICYLLLPLSICTHITSTNSLGRHE